MGFLRDVLFATSFGTGGSMDVFLIALKIPDLFARVLTEGTFVKSLVPALSQARVEGGEARVRRTISLSLGTFGGLLLLIVAASWLARDWLFLLFAPGFADGEEKLKLGGDLLAWTLPYVLLVSVATTYAAILNCHGRFFIPATRVLIYNACLIAAVLFFAPGVNTLAIAVFVSGLFQILSQWPLMLRLRLVARPRWHWSDPDMVQLRRMMLPTLLGASLMLGMVIDAVFASWLRDGSISWLYYAERMVQLPVSILMAGIGAVIMPVLAAHFAEGQQREFSAAIDWVFKVIVVFGLPSTAIFVFMAQPVVETLFGYRAFQPEDVRMTSLAMEAYALGMVGALLSAVLATAAYARRDAIAPWRCGLVGLVVDVAGSSLVIWLDREGRLDAPHAALALCSSASYWTTALLLLASTLRSNSYISDERWGSLLGKFMVATLALSLVGPMVYALLDGGAETGVMKLLRLGVALTAASLAYVLSLRLQGLRLADFRQH